MSTLGTLLFREPTGVVMLTSRSWKQGPSVVFRRKFVLHLPLSAAFFFYPPPPPPPSPRLAFALMAWHHQPIKRGVDVRVCVECGHSGIRAWNASVGEHKLRARKEVSSAGRTPHVTMTDSASSVDSRCIGIKLA